MPGELKGYVGTQAYMAPEVFTKTNTEGHGRAADIYSVGCCVIEMASGKVKITSFKIKLKVKYQQTYIFSDHGTNLIPVSKLCSK